MDLTKIHPEDAALRAILFSEIHRNFESSSYDENPNENPALVFHSPHPDVGSVQVYVEGGQLTVHVGRFDHLHIESYDYDFPTSERLQKTVQEFIDFLNELFADKVLLFGFTVKRFGPYRQVKRGFLSKLLCRGTTYVWSGPIQE